MKKKHLLRSIIAIILCVLMIGTAIAVGYTVYENAQGKKVVIDKDNNKPFVSGSASATVTTENGVTKEEVTLKSSDESILAVIPAGTKLNDGVKEVTLTVKEIKNGQANVELDENEEKSSYDIHVEGVATDNTTPIKVVVKEMLAKGLNIGNYKLYHVENGATVEMTLFDGEVTHNSFEYDPATGDVTLYLASFSEVAVVENTENKWNGTFDYSWYDADSDALFISNADQLAAFGAIVGGMNGKTRDSFENKTVTLTADINLGDKESENNPDVIFHPIGYYFTLDNNGDGTQDDVYSTIYSFCGTFDGNGHTIANFYQNTWEIKGDYNSGYPAGSNYYKDGMGLFGYVSGGTVKNLTVDHFSSDGEFTPTGVIAAYADNSEFINIAITNCNPKVYNTGNGGIVGVGGDSSDTSEQKLNFTNITIDNTNKISALWGSWDVACGGLMGMFRGYSKVTMTNCHVAAQIDVYNDVCGNYQYYWYRYAGMLIGSLRGRNTTDTNGYTVPDMTDIKTVGCTVHFGEWNDYYYCELVANSIASYTHDHQFSRLEIIDALSEIQSGDTWLKTGNFLLIEGETKTCYHIVNKDGVLTQHNHVDAGYEDSIDEDGDGNVDLREDKQIVYLPFNQLFQGDGWGVKHVPIYDDGKTYYEGVTILDREIANSVVKFESSMGGTSIETNTSVTIGDLFQAIKNADVEIVINNVQVTVSPADKDSTVIGTYVANTTDWTKGELSFSGLGNATITITDYYYCTPTTITVTVSEPQDVVKFEAKDNLSFEHTLEDGTINKTLGDIFASVNGAEIDSANVEVVIENNGATCTYTKNDSDWKQSALAFKGVGRITITITDNNRCKTTSATVMVTEPSEEIDFFNLKFKNTEKYLYRVGNESAITLGTLFGNNGNLSVDPTVTISVSGSNNVSYTYTQKSPWSSGTIKFTGTGVITIVIDSNAYTKPLSLSVEVVVGTNVTSTADAKTGNIVLLSDIDSSSITINSGNTFYGNGFVATFAGDGSYRSAALSYGFITIENGGVLDNLQVICKIFPESYMYTNEMVSGSDGRYPYGYSAVVINGSGTISNCYIYGARNNVLVSNANALISNTITECGSLSNIQIKGTDSHTVTLDNVTTIQYQTTSSYNTSKRVMGFGIVVGENVSESNPKLVLKGDLKQYNWVNNTHTDSSTGISNSYAKIAINGALNVQDYQYTIAGKTTVNMGIAFLNAVTASVDDQRINKNVIPYFLSNVTMDSGLGSSYTGQVYSIKKGVSSITESNRFDAKTDKILPYEPLKNNDILPTVKFESDNTALIFTTSFDANSNSWINKLVVDLDNIVGGNYDFYFKDLLVSKCGVSLDFIVKDSSGNTVDKNAAITLNKLFTGSYTLEITDNQIYNADGSLSGDSKVVSVSFVLNATKTSIDPPKFTNAGTATAIRLVSSKGGDWRPAYTALTGVSVTYWSASEGKVKTVDLSTLYNSGTISSNVWTYTCDDYTLTITGGAVHSDGTTITPVVSNNTLYFASTNKAFGTGTTSRSIILNYVFTDKNASTPWNRTETVNYSDLSEYDYDKFKNNGVLEAPSSGGTCLAEGTMITLADGTKKAVEDLRKGDMVMAFDHLTGEIVYKDVIIVVKTFSENNYINTFVFDDGTELKTINEHGIFDLDVNKYVNIDHSNYEQYIGHRFVSIDSNGNIGVKKLVNVISNCDSCYKYDIVTNSTLNYVAEDTLSVTHVLVDVINSFDFGSDLKYDAEKMQSDIETYGLYTYEEWEEYCDISVFEQYQIAVMKVGISKGLYTKEYIIGLINTYVLNDDVQIID